MKTPCCNSPEFSLNREPQTRRSGVGERDAVEKESGIALGIRLDTRSLPRNHHDDARVARLTILDDLESVIRPDAHGEQYVPLRGAQ